MLFISFFLLLLVLLLLLCLRTPKHRSLVTDRLGEYKRVLVGTSLAGTILIFLYLLPGVQVTWEHEMY